MRVRAILSGLKTYLPGFQAPKGAVTSIPARYGYAVWLRHLTRVRDSGLPTEPSVIAGVGRSSLLTIGLAGLLGGAQRYYAVDVAARSEREKQLEVFDELVGLFTQRADIPGDDELPRMRPCLDDYGFPSDLLPEDRLARSLEPGRVAHLRSILAGEARADDGGPEIHQVSMQDAAAIEPETVDLVFSQASLENLGDLDAAHATMAAWLKPGGVASHVIGFGCQKMLPEWNGHWACSALAWRLITGRRPVTINREPLSAHVRLLEQHGCRVVDIQRLRERGGIERRRLARRFRHLSDDDLSTRVAHIVAVREQSREGSGAP